MNPNLDNAEIITLQLQLCFTGGTGFLLDPSSSYIRQDFVQVFFRTLSR
jgi:hypothetical protein